MRKFYYCFFMAILFIKAAQAQTVQINGSVTDTAENKKMAHAVVSLLHKKDSTLQQFARTDKAGKFTLPGINKGRYLLLVTFPRFADFMDEIEVKDADVTLDPIALTLKSTLLKEVIVKSGAAIRIKGDTTEFNADSFAVKEGATVEDLLKRLPGFQVNSKGEITAQGKRVEKVLVDGEEFFGDDPTMATQNLSAKAVDKVQLFDTKTEQQQLTGMTSGNEGKTLNIKLKEDKKKGAFGRLNAGSDFKDYVDAKALYNKFVGKKKVSLYGTKSNVSTGSLNWEDRQKLGIENDYEYDEIGGYYYSFGDNDDFNDWNLRGLPNSYTAGGLFINKWNEDKQSINTSYRFNRLGTENVASTYTQNILPTTINYRNRFTESNGLNQQHALNGKYEWKMDSLTSFKFTTAGVYKTSEVLEATNSEFLNNARQFINKSQQNRHNETERTQLDNQLVYKQLFKKKNRQLLTTLRFGITADEQDGMNYTLTDFYHEGIKDSIDLVDQMRTFDGDSKTWGGKITFNEPLSNKWNLVLDYAHNQNSSTSYRNTFNKSSNGKYETLDPAYSNNFNLDAISNSSTAIMRFVDKKVKMALGAGVSAVNLKLFDVETYERNNFHFTNLTPQAQVGYTFKPQTNLSVNYRGTTRQPTINQLQPIRDNNDPLYVFVGNPDLKVGFNHSFRLSFNQYKVLSSRSIWISASYSLTDNAIANYTIIDTVRGKQVYTPVNVNGNSSWNMWGNWNKGQGENKLNYGVQIGANGGVSNNFIDQKGVGVKNQTTYNSLELNLSIGLQKPEKVSFYLRPSIGYQSSRSTLQPQLSNNYYTYGGFAEGFLMLPGKLELNTEANFNLQQKLPQFPGNMNYITWNASLARKVLKDKSGKIILAANDLLDQNRGFNRIINSNFVQEERYSRISRYFLLKFEWSFNKMPGSK